MDQLSLVVATLNQGKSPLIYDADGNSFACNSNLVEDDMLLLINSLKITGEVSLFTGYKTECPVDSEILHAKNYSEDNLTKQKECIIKVQEYVRASDFFKEVKMFVQRFFKADEDDVSVEVIVVDECYAVIKVKYQPSNPNIQKDIFSQDINKS